MADSSAAASSSPNTATLLSWSDLHSLHSASTVGCQPHSLPSIVTHIALEGGRQGCSASQLCNIVHRHTVRSADELRQPLDMRIMEQWWQHIRQHKHITVYQQAADSVAPSTASSASVAAASANEWPAKAGKGYRRRAELQSGRTAELTDDGVLFPPLGRTPLPAESLAQLSFTASEQQHPTLTAVASSSLRRTLLGLPPLHSQPLPPSSDDERESGNLTASSYCALESLGKAGVAGLWQQHLGGLLGLSANNMHPLLFWMRLRQQVSERMDRGKNRVWLSGWRERADREAGMRRAQERLSEEWWADERRHKRFKASEKGVLDRWEQWRTATTQSRPTLYQPFDLLREDDSVDGDLFVPELQHSTYTATDEWPAHLSMSDYIYRAISRSPGGLQMDDLRQLLPSQSVKAINRLLPALGESLGVLSVPDRKGRTLSYRFMTQQQYDRIKQEEEGGSAAAEERKEVATAEKEEADRGVQQPEGEAMAEEEKEERKDTAPEGKKRVSWMPQARAPYAWLTASHRSKSSKAAAATASRAEEQKDVSPADGIDSSASFSSSDTAFTSAPTVATALPTTPALPAVKADRGIPLIAMQRRRAVESLLAAAPSQLLSAISLSRSLAASHPPAMDKKTAQRFFDAMQLDGLLTLYTFLFPSHSGRGSHQVTIAGLRVKGDEAGSGESAGEFEKKRLAHELALVQLSDSGTREKAKVEEVWDKAMQEAADRLRHKTKMKLEQSADGSGAAGEDSDTKPPPRKRRTKQEMLEAARLAKVKLEDGDGEGDGEGKPDAVLQVSRQLLGYIVPQMQRVHYLHRLLWSAYRQPPLAVVHSRSFPSVPSPMLCIDYADVARRMRLSDFLLLCGGIAEDCSTLPFVSDPSMLDRPMDELPASVHALIVPRSGSSPGAYRQLVKLFDVLTQLRLIQPLAADNPTSTSMQSLHSLSPTFSNGATTFHFSSPGELEAYWSELRTLCTAKKESRPARLTPWQLPATTIDRMRNQRLWRFLAVRSRSHCAQLDEFAQKDEKAVAYGGGMALMDVRQIQRAADALQLRIGLVTSYYARRLLPQLAVVHDELDAYTESLANEKETKVKVKLEPREETEPPVRKQSRKRKLPPPVAASESDEELPDAQHETTEPRLDDSAATPATRRPRGSLHAPFSTGEDERLIAMLGEWLQRRARQPQPYLPFVFTAPPHVDTALDDGLAIRLPIPSSSSMSVYAASFDTVQPLLSPVEPLPSKTKPTQESDEAQLGFSVAPDEHKSTESLTGLSASQLKRRVNYVLHNTPIEEQAEPAAESAEGEEKREDEQAEPRDTDDVEATHVHKGAVRASVLDQFCAYASTKFRNRSARAIHHQMERAVVRLILPVACTAAASSVATTGRRLLIATPAIAAYIAANPIAASLLPTLTRAVLESDESYKEDEAHAMTAAYAERMVGELLEEMKTDRLITRRKNAYGKHRSWKVTKLAHELLFSQGEAEQQSGAQKEALRQQWSDAALGAESRLLTPISQLQADAVVEGLDAGDVTLPLPRTEQMQPSSEESKEDEMEDEGEERKEEGTKADGEQEKDVEMEDKGSAAVSAADAAARWGFAGYSVTIVNTHWRMTEQRDALTDQPATHEPERSPRSKLDAESEETDPLPVYLLEDGEKDEMEEEEEQQEVQDQRTVQQQQKKDSGADGEQQLCDGLTDALTKAGAAGLTRRQLHSAAGDGSEERGWDDGRYDFAVRSLGDSLFDRALQRGLLGAAIIAVPSFDQQRFAAGSYADFLAPVGERQAEAAVGADRRWAAQCREHMERSLADECVYEPRALVSHKWRLFSGDVNQPLLSSLYSTLLASVRRWPGIEEARLSALLPALTVSEVRHVLQLLVLDDKVHARWQVGEVEEDGGGGKRRQRLASYFPVLQQQ